MSNLRDPSAAFTKFKEQDAGLIQIVNQALADAVERGGKHLACRPGCTQCCHGTFPINSLDAARLRAAMADLAVQNPELEARLAARAQTFLSEFAESFPGDRASGTLGKSPEAQEAFAEFANDAPCPALDPVSGYCDLYEARPITCRVFGPPVRMTPPIGSEENPQTDFAVCELCYTEALPDEVEAGEMHLPHEEERQLLEAFERETAGSQDKTDQEETIVAYCLVPLAAPMG